MRTTDIVWKESVVEKLIDKHGASIWEVEKALFSQPLVRRMVKGRARGEDVYAAMAQVRSG